MIKVLKFDSGLLTLKADHTWIQNTIAKHQHKAQTLPLGDTDLTPKVWGNMPQANLNYFISVLSENEAVVTTTPRAIGVWSTMQQLGSHLTDKNNGYNTIPVEKDGPVFLIGKGVEVIFFGVVIFFVHVIIYWEDDNALN